MSNNKDSVQNLRKSQFILTFGPGAIIEGVNGPRLIPSLRTGLSNNKFEGYVKKYEVHNLRMSSILENNEDNKNSHIVKFFNLPTNASEGRSDSQGIYRTFIFPVWKICYGKHKEGYPILYNSSKHRSCPDSSCDSQIDSYVRFVCACPDGHLDEVPWARAVHYKKNGKFSDCNYNDYFRWEANGSSLSDIKITCPICEASITMKEVYQMPIFCTGRFPENEHFPNKNGFHGVSFSAKRKKGSCKNKMAIIQRQSTSLRIANTLTLLKIPKYEKHIIKTLEEPIIKSLTKNAYPNDRVKDYMKKDSYLEVLNRQSPDKYREILKCIEKNSYETFLDKAKQLYEGDYSFENILLEEFETLRGEYQSEEYFEKDALKEVNVKIKGEDFLFKVASVDKVTTVTAQIGYQRKPYLKKEEDGVTFIPPKMIYNGQEAHDDNDKKCVWYPVYDAVGEGIFITSDINPISYLNLEDNAKEWFKNKPNFITKSENVKNPLFVWWHSLSHALIKTLSFKSGYSAASIRERVYVDLENGTGGILLYTTSSGEDCSMGGLVDSIKNIDNIIKDAFNSVKICSYDPLCLSSRVSSDKINGAACIYCLLLPETSCEHNNMWLDRHLLLGN